MPQPYAHAVIRQYALLLMSSNVIAGAVVFLGSSNIQVERTIAAALALYHIGPEVRAVSRLGGLEGLGRPIFAQPYLHLSIHLICNIALAGRAVDCW